MRSVYLSPALAVPFSWPVPLPLEYLEAVLRRISFVTVSVDTHIPVSKHPVIVQMSYFISN